MILKVTATDSLKGAIQLPGSKSHTIRAFIVAACGGNSLIRFPSDCDDALAALRTAKALGARVKKRNNSTWQIRAKSGRKLKSARIHVGESGTVLRFLLPLAALKFEHAVITGEGTLVGRPNKHLIVALRKIGFRITGKGLQGSVPVILDGGVFSGGTIRIDGTISSQFVSALLIAVPALPSDTRVIITGKRPVSQDYIVMTEQVLKKSGIRVIRKSARNFLIKGRQKFKGLKNFKVPSDYGLAAFPMAAAILLKSRVTLKGFLKDELLQSDGRILDVLRKMGIRFTKTALSIKIHGPQQLKGGSFSLKDSPDLLPILAVLALFAKGPSRFYDIGHARVKESDRISDLRKELLKVGADVREKSGEIRIYPRPRYKSNQVLDPHRDHRLAMAFSVLGLKVGLSVKDIECVRKSYPAFTQDLKRLSANVSLR